MSKVNPYKNITFPIHGDDIRPLVKSHLLTIIERNSLVLQSALTGLDEIFNDEERTEDIIPGITELSGIYQTIAAQLRVPIQMASLLSQAEVLEDLSDLEEDSLGVDSGSE